MPKFLRVAKKEFLDMFRDRRSIIRMMLIPLIAFPIIINLVVTIQSSVSESAAKEELTVGYISKSENNEIIERLSEMKLMKVKEFKDSVEMRDAVKNDKILAGLIIPSSYTETLKSNGTAQIDMIFRGADMEETDRLKDSLAVINKELTSRRLEINELNPGIVSAINYDVPYKPDMNEAERGMLYMKYNVSDRQEIIGKYAGGFLPYIFIAFLFMGCMYPAIDLFAGEKERGTMETLLTTPVHRTQILLGKMIVILSFGLLSATLALTGLFLSLNIIDINAEMMAVINDILSPTLILTLYVLLIPLAIFFTGLMTPISIYAKSYKEAQSTMVPLNIIVVLPAVAGFIPGIELNYVTAFIPIVNVVLATKQIIAGNMDIILVGITFISLVLLAAISVAISYKQFGKESNILRGD
jgi:sodium transport system permease protein